MQRIDRLCQRIIFIGFSLLALLVPLLLTPFNYELFEYNKMMAVYGITAVILAAWLGKMIAQKRLFVARTPFDIPIGLFVISQLVSSVFSMDPHVSWFGYYSRFNGGMISIICYVGLFYAFVSTITKDQLPKLMKFLLGTASIVAFYGVLEHVGIDKHLWVQDVQSRVFSTLGQPNWLAAYLTALIPITLAFSYMYKPVWIYSIVPAILTLLFFLTLLFTGSRSGLVAFFVVDILFWLGIWLVTPSKRTLRSSLIITHVVFFLCIFFTGTHTQKLDKWITFDGIKQQLTTKKMVTQEPTVTIPTGPVLETGGTESGVIRTYVWQGALQAWRSSLKTLAIGTGTETFAFAFYQHKPIGHNLTSEWDFLYNKAHNEYLNTLATTGLVGLATYLSILVSIILWFVHTLKKHTASYVLLLGIFLGWLSILITNFFGFSVVVTQLLLFLLPAGALLVTDALLTATPSTKKSQKTTSMMVRTAALTLTQKAQRILLATATLVAVGIIIILVMTWFGDKKFATGYRLSRAGQYAQAYGPLSQAVTINTIEPLYRDEFANTLAALAVAAFENEDATLSGALAFAAKKENEKAIAISPNNVNFWKSKTKIYYALTSIDPTVLPIAMDALKQAQRLSPMDPKITYNLAILSGKAGNSSEAIAYLNQSIALKPNYRDAYYALHIFYQETNQREEARKVIETYLQTVDNQDEEFKKLVE